MMAFTFSDDDYSLKTEKADAIRKFNQQQNILYFGRLLVALVLLLWSLKTLPQMASLYVSVFGQQLCAFLVANAIVIFVYHFSTAAANNTIAAADKAEVVKLSSASSSPATADSSSSFRSDIFDEYVSLSSRRPTVDGGEGVEVPPAAEILSPAASDARDGVVMVKEVDRVGLALTEGFSDGRRHRRARSVVEEETVTKSFSDGMSNSRRDKVNESGGGGERKELRRSETVVMKTRRKKPAMVGKSLSFNQARKSIEEMNNDEFNMTVESFIATKKKLLRDENIATLATD